VGVLVVVPGSFPPVDRGTVLSSAVEKVDEGSGFEVLDLVVMAVASFPDDPQLVLATIGVPSRNRSLIRHETLLQIHNSISQNVSDEVGIGHVWLRVQYPLLVQALVLRPTLNTCT